MLTDEQLNKIFEWTDKGIEHSMRRLQILQVYKVFNQAKQANRLKAELEAPHE